MATNLSECAQLDEPMRRRNVAVIWAGAGIGIGTMSPAAGCLVEDMSRCRVEARGRTKVKVKWTRGSG